MKIYTKKGDSGETSLTDGTKTTKDDLRVECYGNIDELNATIGHLREELKASGSPLLSQLILSLKTIQLELFNLGTEVASPKPEMFAQVLLSDEETLRLEKEIDIWTEKLPPLRNFIIPGSSVANALGHICRTVCRRAERSAVHLSREVSLRPGVIRYLNRLSDWLFVSSRFVSYSLGEEEFLWEGRAKGSSSFARGNSA